MKRVVFCIEKKDAEKCENRVGRVKLNLADASKVDPGMGIRHV